MARAGRKLGHDYMAITDHSQALKFVGGLDATRFRAQDGLIRRLNDEYAAEGVDFRLLHGSEADILLDGAVDLVPEVLDCIDWAIGSVHSYFHIPAEDQTARIIRAIESGHIDMLGHPTGRILESRPPYAVNMEAVIEAAARTGVALEINSIERLDLNDEHARWAKQAGAWVVINTDAHATSQLQALPHGIDVARRGWLEAGNVLNTYPLEFLREHRRERLARAGLRPA
jgi:DNA polymerase (family 10)